MMRGTTPELQERARELRWSMTPAEQVLWEALRGRKLDGLRFRTQHPVGRFILDFYCPERKLVVEVDGEIHDEQAERDQARTAHLEAYGYRVIRFRNDEIMNDLASVLDRIRTAAVLPPQPPDNGGSKPLPAPPVVLPPNSDGGGGAVLPPNSGGRGGLPGQES